MKAFTDAIERIDEINMPKECQPLFKTVMGKLSAYLDNLGNVQPDFEKLFDQFLYNNLKIRLYNPEVERMSHGEASRYEPGKNEISLDNSDNEAHLCHEFIHFMIHNLYPYQFKDLSNNPEHPMPSWLDERLTQKMTEEVTGKSTMTYQRIGWVSDFMERQTQPFTILDFINGRTADQLFGQVPINRYSYRLNQIMRGDDDENMAVIMKDFALRFGNKLASNPDIKLETLLNSMAEFEAQNLADGKCDSSRFDTVFRWLKKEDRLEIYYNLLGAFLNVRGVKSYRDIIGHDDFVYMQNYIDCAKYELLNKNGWQNFRITDEQKYAKEHFEDFKKNLAKRCADNKNAQQEDKINRAMERFLDGGQIIFLNKDTQDVEKGIKNFNSIKDLLQKEVVPSRKMKSYTNGSAYWCTPIFKQVDDNDNKLSIDITSPDDIEEIAESLELDHGDQVNLCVDMGGKKMAIANIGKFGGDISFSINWKGVWPYLPKEVQEKIQTKVAGVVEEDSESNYNF